LPPLLAPFRDFPIPIHSKRLVFAQDISGGMESNRVISDEAVRKGITIKGTREVLPSLEDIFISMVEGGGRR